MGEKVREQKADSGDEQKGLSHERHVSTAPSPQFLYNHQFLITYIKTIIRRLLISHRYKVVIGKNTKYKIKQKSI